MNPFIYNLVEANVYLAFFALAYWLFVRSETFFRLNRGVLLSMLALSFILPFVSFPALQSAIETYTIALPSIEIGSEGSANFVDRSWALIDVLMATYFIGLIAFAMHFAYQLLSTLLLIHGKKKVRSKASGLTEIESDHAPASFFSFIFWSPKIADADAEMIRAHEAVHAEEWHSIDLLLIRVAACVCWFNPAVHYIKKSIEANHEFRADQVVAHRHNDIYTYSKVLLGQAMGVNHQVFAHHFSKPNLLKTRIMMLNKKQSQKSALLKYVFLIPVLGLALAFNACTKEGVNAGENINAQPHTPAPPNPPTPGEKIPGTDVYTIVENMPTFKGGDGALMVWLGDNIKYPEAAKDAGAEGLVFVKFVVDKDGHIRDAQQVERQESSQPTLSLLLVQAAIKAISDMPAWTPGEHEGMKVSVQYILPVNFTLKS